MAIRTHLSSWSILKIPLILEGFTVMCVPVIKFALPRRDLDLSVAWDSPLRIYVICQMCKAVLKRPLSLGYFMAMGDLVILCMWSCLHWVAEF